MGLDVHPPHRRLRDVDILHDAHLQQGAILGKQQEINKKTTK